MFKSFLAVLLIVGLAGCPWGRGDIDLTPCGEVYALKGEFSILVDKVNAYAAQPFCTEQLAIACADPRAVIEMSKAADAVKPSLDLAESQCTLSEDATLITLNATRALLLTLSTTYAGAITRAVQ